MSVIMYRRYSTAKVGGLLDAGRHQRRHVIVYFALYGINTKTPYKQSRHLATPN